MSIIKNIWKVLVKAGLVTFTWAIMFVGAISIFSLVNKRQIYYGKRCSAFINEETIDYLNQEEIIAYDYELKCNTLYLDLSVDDELSSEQIIALLTRISTYYNFIGHQLNTQVTVKNINFLVLASLIKDGGVSLSISKL